MPERKDTISTTRRLIATGSIAALGLSFLAVGSGSYVSSLVSPAYASQDRGGVGPGIAPPRIIVVSRAQIRRMRKAELVALEVQYRREDTTVELEGFSNNMTSHVMAAAYAMPWDTLRLLKRLDPVKKKKQRVAILTEEITKIERLIELLKRSIRRSEESSGERNREERIRLRRAEAYLETIEVWKRFPQEGTRD